jgi:hypothetical protein
MRIGDRWQRWWERLTHGAPEQTPDGVDRRGSGDARTTRATPQAGRPIGQVPAAPDGELKLSVEPNDRSIRQRKQIRTAGFDPYSNDAGYEKPRNWDEVDPR